MSHLCVLAWRQMALATASDLGPSSFDHTDSDSLKHSSAYARRIQPNK